MSAIPASTLVLLVGISGSLGCLGTVPTSKDDLGPMGDAALVGIASTLDFASGGSDRDLAATPLVDMAMPVGGMTVVCDKAVSTSTLSIPSGHHNPGQACLNCHSGEFTVAGTLYSSATGSTAVAGATIDIVDANGKTTSVVTANNGNFWTLAQIAFPVTVRGSLCPTIQRMSEQVTDGSCNSCHDSTMRIHVP